MPLFDVSKLPKLKNLEALIEIADLAQHIEQKVISACKPQQKSGVIKAVVEIAPNAFTLLYSISALVEKRQAFCAEILCRALLERIAILSYFEKNGQVALEIWQKGWDYKDRPSIKHMLKEMDEPTFISFPNQIEGFALKDQLIGQVDQLNQAVHADPIGSYRNSFFSEIEAELMVSSGSSIMNPEYVDSVAALAAALGACLIHQITSFFPETRPKEYPK